MTGYQYNFIQAYKYEKLESPPQDFANLDNWIDRLLKAKLTTDANDLQARFCPQFFALFENFSKPPILLIVYIIGHGHSEEALLNHVKCGIP